MNIVMLGIASNTIAPSVGNVWLFPDLALAVSIINHAVVTLMYVYFHCVLRACMCRRSKIHADAPLSRLGSLYHLRRRGHLPQGWWSSFLGLAYLDVVAECVPNYRCLEYIS
jgi:hypothetical protein